MFYSFFIYILLTFLFIALCYIQKLKKLYKEDSINKYNKYLNMFDFFYVNFSDLFFHSFGSTVFLITFNRIFFFYKIK